MIYLGWRRCDGIYYPMAEKNLSLKSRKGVCFFALGVSLNLKSWGKTIKGVIQVKEYSGWFYTNMIVTKIGSFHL